MAKPKYGTVVNYKKTFKGTSIGKNPITSTMNKNKRKGRSKKQIKRSRRRSKLRLKHLAILMPPN